MADQQSSDEFRGLVQQHGIVYRVLDCLRSSRVVKVIVIVIVGATCILMVAYCIRSMYRNVQHLQSTIQRLHGIIEVLNEKLERQISFITSQQEAILSILQVVETRSMRSDSNTRELLQKNVERVQHLTDQMKSVQAMAKRQESASLEKAVGGAVVTSVKSVLPVPGYLSSVVWRLMSSIWK